MYIAIKYIKYCTVFVLNVDNKQLIWQHICISSQNPEITIIQFKARTEEVV